MRRDSLYSGLLFGRSKDRNHSVNIIYGVAPVLEALRAGRRPVERLVLAIGANPERLRELTEAARRAGVTVEKRDRRELDDLSRRANHQGVLAILAGGKRGSAYVDAATILTSIGKASGAESNGAGGESARHPLVVLLDGIEDPHNLGAILRTCECAGVDGVFIPEHRAAGITEIVAKTSAGAVEYLKIAQVTNLVPLILELKERGFWIAAIEGGASTTYTSFDLTMPLAIVLGSEGKGVRRLVREKCDVTLSIPMLGRVNSLNVSVAAGVVLFEAVRQRRGSANGE